VPLIDTHAHLFDDRFADDLAEVVQRSLDVGVTGIVAVGIDAASNRASVAIAHRFPNVLAAVGIQPNHVAESVPGDWDEVVRLVETEPKVAAVGETGLDRYWDRAPFAMQEEFFARHLELARKHQKPVVIHCREAEADVSAMLRTQFDRHGPVKGVMHSYTGDATTAKACLEMGFHVSFAGMVTFKTAGDLRAVAKAIPADRILVETDCPYLAPQAVRGKRNEPAYVVHTATVLAAERGESFEEFSRQTTANAKMLFGIG
jgi:TatD DNase family protein